VLWVSWRAGRRNGLVIAAVGAVAWLAATGSAGAPIAPLVWNTAVRLGLYSVLGYLAATLRSSLERERVVSRTDFVTGAANRRAFEELLERELARSTRSGRPLSVVYLDLDRFKRVNDEMGHEAGDRLLRSVADALRRNCRTQDVVARLGGDEFAVLLTEAGEEAARRCAPRMLAHLDRVARENKWPVTASFGVVTAVPPVPTVEDLLAAADHLMYSAKRDPEHRVRYQLLTSTREEGRQVA
jgi:diguanylate cyclase (GGDEF)-like protein